MTAELWDGESAQQPRSRQNSLDFCINKWSELQAAAAEEEEKAALEKQESMEKEACVEHVEVVSEPPKAHARAARYRLSEYLPGFAGDADHDCQEIELGIYPHAVHRSPKQGSPTAQTQSTEEAPAQRESLLDRLVRCFT